jgi:hypothetical protein
MDRSCPLVGQTDRDIRNDFARAFLIDVFVEDSGRLGHRITYG